MFTFINTSRIGTAVQGVAGAENAYQNSLYYAKVRRVRSRVRVLARALPRLCLHSLGR